MSDTSKRKTVSTILDEVRDKMCEHYCKYNDKIAAADDEAEADYLVEKYCEGCPLELL